MPSARPKSAAHADKHGDKPARKTDKDLPLIEDIRLLGRILGDVIREQEGGPAYELVEQVRQLSVAFRRDADEAADKANRAKFEKECATLIAAGGPCAPWHKNRRASGRGIRAEIARSDPLDRLCP